MDSKGMFAAECSLHYTGNGVDVPGISGYILIKRYSNEERRVGTWTSGCTALVPLDTLLFLFPPSTRTVQRIGGGPLGRPPFCFHNLVIDCQWKGGGLVDSAR